MTEPLAEYGFIPWLRRGLGTRITRVDGLAIAQPEPRPEITFRLNFNADAFGSELDLAIAGPGEVGSIDQRVVIRRVPERDIHDAEPNYFPFLEFSEPDLPWLHTPAKAPASERLTPWISLICLADKEIAEYRPAGPDQQLPVVRVADASVLPPWDQLWAWAHAQLSGDKTPDAVELADVFLNHPERLVSRVLSPRRLDQKTSYRGFLVPSFERGRLAGLGREVPETLDGLAPSWTNASTDLELPVYYEWRFETGVLEDFEFLARQLKPFVMPEEVGRRDMDVSDPGLSLPPAAPYPLALEGALRAVSGKSTDWKDADKVAFAPKLTTLVNLPEDSLTTAPAMPIVAPPLYGRWHAVQKRLLSAATALPKWFHQLNADPRLRVTSALGTLVIQQQQRQLMASAWEQVGPIRAINEERRKKQLAKLAATRIYDRHWSPLDSESLLFAGAPILSRIRGSRRTVHAYLRASPIAPGALDPQLRRISRALGPFGRRQDRRKNPRANAMLDRMNRGELAGSYPPALPDGIVTPGRAGEILGTQQIPRWLARLLSSIWFWLLLLLIVAVLLLIAGAPLVLVLTVVAAIIIVAILVRRWSGDVERRAAVTDGTLTADQVRSAPQRPDFVPSITVPGAGPAPPPTRVPAGMSRQDTPSGRIFRDAAASALARAHMEVKPGVVLQAVDLPALATTVRVAIDPRVTIGRGVNERVTTDGTAALPDDPVEEVMAAPDFPQPMYEPLRDLGQDWLLPGLEKVPSNSVSLLETNQARFIEPYMLGLSHEMSRELLWNEYPTDQRGTYFRQFWDVRGYVPPPDQQVDQEKLKDIKSIHLWARDLELGANSPRDLPPSGKHLVLLVRGDLLRRYPNTIIYAVPAVLRRDGKFDLGSETDELHPVFRGTLKPDVTFFGFELTASQVRGTQGSGSDPGWFFVLQEQPAEPRFGLDLPDPENTPYGARPTGWDDLSWGSLAANDLGLKGITYIDLTAPLPDTALLETAAGPVWRAAGGPRGSRASDLAYVTLQVPVRIGIHGSRMIPPDGAGA